MRTAYYFFLAALLLISACKQEDPPAPEPVPLNADAGTNQTVRPQETVSLDGSRSTGPDGFTYSWTYSGEVPESEIQFEGKTSSKPSFVPPEGAVYTFTLTISSNGESSSDQVTVVATGGIEIGGTLTENLILTDIEPDAMLPDYVVTSDLIVPNGLSISFADNNVRVFFEEGTGIWVQQGGTLTNVLSGQTDGLEVTFTGDESQGWKGILIQDGTIELNDAKIEFAGKGIFDGQAEPASLTMTGEATQLVSLDGNDIDHSFSYSVYVPEPIGGSGYFTDNHLSYQIPIKAHILFLQFWNSNDPNSFPDTYDYNHISPSGASQKDSAVGPGTLRFYEGKYFVDNDIWAVSSLSFTRATIFMKEGTGILAEERFNCSGQEGDEVLVTGYQGAEWKGIAAIDRSYTYSLRYTTIEDAGFGEIEIGNFKAEAPASLYSSKDVGSLEYCRILDGGGYGYYNEDTVSRDVATRIEFTEFSNLPLPAIRTNVRSVSRIFSFPNRDNTYSLPAGTPAILVQGNGRPIGTWPALGNGNFYLIDAFIDHENYQDVWKLDPGVHLKFSAGQYYRYDPPNGNSAQPVSWLGTSDDPIIIEGESNSAGSWGGVYLGGADGWFKINHCIIRNGGAFQMPDATEKANIISAYTGDWANLAQFTNTEVSGSAGYGIVVEANTHDFEFDNANKNNTFSNNASGDVLVK